MANTPKKKNAGSSAKSGSKRRSAPPPPAYNAQARIIGGIVCLLLALCVLVTYFNVDAILLTFLANVLKGCVGYGYWLAAPALLYAGIVLVGHKGRPVKLRTTCTLLLPVLVGMVLHLLLSRGGYAFSLENIKPMWKDGQSLLCGGVVSGLLAVAMEALLSRVVSLILTILLTLLAVLGALQIKPAELAADIFEYGILLSGGGAELFGLCEAIADTLKVPCSCAEDPQNNVVIGCGRALENMADLGKFLDDGRRRMLGRA